MQRREKDFKSKVTQPKSWDRGEGRLPGTEKNLKDKIGIHRGSLFFSFILLSFLSLIITFIPFILFTSSSIPFSPPAPFSPSLSSSSSSFSSLSPYSSFTSRTKYSTILDFAKYHLWWRLPTHLHCFRMAITQGEKLSCSSCHLFRLALFCISVEYFIKFFPDFHTDFSGFLGWVTTLS